MFTFNHHPQIPFILEAHSVSAETKCREIDCIVENFLTNTIWTSQDCKLTKRARVWTRSYVDRLWATRKIMCSTLQRGVQIWPSSKCGCLRTLRVTVYRNKEFLIVTLQPQMLSRDNEGSDDAVEMAGCCVHPAVVHNYWPYAR
jgi:hypothetical protein